MRGDVTNVSVFLSRVRRERKGRSDRISDCQDWQDISSENAANEIEPIETSAQVVDGRQKVHCSCLTVTLKAHLFMNNKKNNKIVGLQFLSKND